MGAVPIKSTAMDAAIRSWLALEKGKPNWLYSGDEDIRCIRFSNTLARELALLITESIDVKAEPKYRDTEFAKKLQEGLDKHFLTRAVDPIQRMITTGGIMAKWNGNGFDYLAPDRFEVTEYDASKHIIGAIFKSSCEAQGKYFTRYEWHRFENGTYVVTNKVTMSDFKDQQGNEIDLAVSPWKNLTREVRFDNLEHPLFAYLRNPFTNTVDPDSPLGVSSFAECMEELRWLDIAMSTWGVETETSKPMLFIDPVALTYARKEGIKIPKFVNTLGRTGMVDDTIEQWQPQLQTQARIDGINFYLNVIASKVGFDPGYFTFNGQTISLATATQVEATERKTVKTVMAYRSLLDRPKSNGDGRTGFVHELAQIIAMMDVLDGKTAPEDYQNYRLYCDFADLTENREEDKNFEYQLASTGYMAKWQFLVRNLGLTETDAKRMVKEAQKEVEQTMMSEAEAQVAVDEITGANVQQAAGDNRLNNKDDHSSGTSLFDSSPESRKHDMRQTRSAGYGE